MSKIKQMSPETMQALGELVRAAAKHAGFDEKDGPIEFTVCRPGPEWCGTEDNAVSIEDVKDEDFFYAQHTF